MPRYEIVAHVTRDLESDTAEEAAAIFRRQLLSEARLADTLLHLAVWRQDPDPAPSPLPASLRQTLTGFFVALERCAGEAEAAFRGRVEALLMAPAAAPEQQQRSGRSGSAAPAPRDEIDRIRTAPQDPT